MKRGLPWNDDDSSSSEESSSTDTDTETVENDVASKKNAKSCGTSNKKIPEGNVASACSCDPVRNYLLL